MLRFRALEKGYDLLLTVDCAETDTDHNIGLATEYISKLKLRDAGRAAAIVVGPPVMTRYAAEALK